MKYLLLLLFFVSYSIQSNEPYRKSYYEWKPDQFHKGVVLEADSIELIAKGRVNVWSDGKVVKNVDSTCLIEVKL